jgi:L-2-hydroxyglutarate oxidase LhgO
MANFKPNTQVDFVVIGSGIAGGIMAKELSRSLSEIDCRLMPGDRTFS